MYFNVVFICREADILLLLYNEQTVPPTIAHTHRQGLKTQRNLDRKGLHKWIQPESNLNGSSRTNMIGSSFLNLFHCDPVERGDARDWCGRVPTLTGSGESGLITHNPICSRTQGNNQKKKKNKFFNLTFTTTHYHLLLMETCLFSGTKMLPWSSQVQREFSHDTLPAQPS